MLAVYHRSDLDGMCSGAIVKYKYPECELIGFDYGDEFPWDRVGPEDQVYMVDVALQPFDEMIALKDQAGLGLVWIDHHKSTIKSELEYYEKYQIHARGCIDGIRKVGTAACELTWEFLFPDKPMPIAVKLLGRYDVWDHWARPNVLPFQYGMRLLETRPDRSMGLWKQLFNGDIARESEICETGYTIIRYRRQSDLRYCRLNAFETELNGLKCIALNLGKPYISSRAFEAVWDPEKYDAMIGFCRKKGTWEVNLYTDKEGVDVSVIAKSKGGGGHEQAAGFQTEKLPFALLG